MIRPLEPSPLDEEPLLRPPEKQGDAGAAGGMRQRPGGAGAATHHYSTRARSVVLRVHDQIIRIADEEDVAAHDDDDDDDNEDDDGRRLRVSNYIYGACGLRSFGHSQFWRFLGGLFKLIYAYYFFIWTIVYGGLALCFLISIVYEGWSTGDPLGTAAIVVSMLPVMNLLWIFFSFVLHGLFVGVFWDFYDLDSSLHAIRIRLQSSSAKAFLTVLVAFLINGPVLFSLVVFCVATAKPVSDRLWTAQFFLSFISNVLLAFLFFGGALIGRDHPLPDPVQEQAAKRRETLAEEINRSRASWCYRCVPSALRRAVRGFFHSEAFGAVRVYVKSSFQGGGILSVGGTVWGRYAADAFLPAPVDLEGTTALDGLADASELKGVEVEGRGVKPWPSPWYLGWYIRRWWCRGRARSRRSTAADGSSSSSAAAASLCSSCLCGGADATQCCVALPWTLLLAALLLTLAVVAFSVKAYLLMGFVIVFFIFLPLFYQLLTHTIRASFMGLLLVDLLLIVAFTAAFFLSLSVASYYLGYPVLLIILAANLLTLLAHVPAIRDKPYPPSQDHAQSLAFNAKRITHRIITTARAWSWASIIILLVLVLMMKTVPANYTTDDAATFAASQLRQQRARMMKKWAGAGGAAGGAGGMVGLGAKPQEQVPPLQGKNGSGLQQPPQPYAFCGQTFSRARLSVLDLAHVSNAAYMELDEARDYVSQEVTGAARFNLTLLEMEGYGPITYLMDDESSQTLVFAIRGTNAVVDLFQDLDLYSEAIVIQTSTSLFPLYASPVFQNILNKFVGTDYHLVETLTLLKDALLNRPAQRGKDGPGGSSPRTATTGAMATPDSRLYYKQLERYIREEILPNPRYANYQFLLTGHSLGGGVASIVGARLQALAVTFSSPGVVLSRRKFGLSLKEISQYVVNIVPQGDLVPLIDVQGVKAQSIVCSANRLKYHCHSILSTIGEIEETCQQGRAWRQWQQAQEQGQGHEEEGSGDL